MRGILALLVIGVIMALNQIGGDTTDPNQIVNQMNQNIAELKSQQVTNIFKDDTGTRRVLLGRGKDGFYGLKVSQPNTDVYDGADEDMAFNSNNNVFKIVTTGTTTVNANATAGVLITKTIPHGLSYTPVAWVFFERSPGIYSPLPNSTALTASGGNMLHNNWVWTEVDGTNLYIQFLSGSTSNWGILPFRYYLLQETAN